MKIDFLIKALFHQDSSIPQHFDIIQFASKNGVGGWLFELHNAQLNDDQSQQFKWIFLKSFQHNTLLINEWSAVEKVLKSNQIQFELIKGMRLINQIYSDKGHRAISDIDVLIRSCDYDLVQRLMIQELNYLQKESYISNAIPEVREILDQHFPQFVKEKVVIEFHRHLNQSLHHYDIPLPIIEKFFGKEEFEYLHFFFVLSHAYKHLLEGKFQFKFLVDIVLYEKHYRYFGKTKVFFEKQGLISQIELIDLWRDDIINLEFGNYDSLKIKPLKIFIENGDISFGNINAYKRLSKLSFKDKFLYLYHYIFPDKSMIINNFQPKNKFQFYRLYLLWIYGRISKGILRLFKIN